MPDKVVLVFQKPMIYWHFHTTPSLRFTKRKGIYQMWMKTPCWCQWRKGRLVWDDRKVTVNNITICCNQSHNVWNLKADCQSCWAAQWVPLLSARNGKLKLQITQNHLNWFWKKIVWPNETQFLMEIFKILNGKVKAAIHSASFQLFKQVVVV